MLAQHKVQQQKSDGNKPSIQDYQVAECRKYAFSVLVIKTQLAAIGVIKSIETG